jgi:serine/threonine protein kinase
MPDATCGSARLGFAVFPMPARNLWQQPQRWPHVWIGRDRTLKVRDVNRVEMSAGGTVLHPGEILDRRYRIITDGLPLDIGVTYNAFDMQRVCVVVVEVLASRYGQGADAMLHLRRHLQATPRRVHSLLIDTDGVGLVGGSLYTVRRQIGGETVSGMLAREGKLHVGAAVQTVFDLCHVLAALHLAGQVHGGLSSNSVLVHDGALVAVTDGGLLPALHARASATGRPWGRIPYLSPEHASGADISPTSDVYVVGLLLYEMLAGCLPFAAGGEAELVLRYVRDDPPPVQTHAPDTPDHLARIVHLALAKDPTERFQNGSEMAKALSLHLHAGLAREGPWLESLQPPSPRPQLIVPPVSGDDFPSTPPSLAVAAPTEETDDQRSGARTDWIIVALLIAGIMAILGLIPLWRTVYRRYAVPASYSSRCLALPGHELASEGSDLVDSRGRAPRVGKLEDSEPVWYNASNAGRISSRGADNYPVATSPEPVTTSRFGSPDYGPLVRVDYTGRAKILGGI